MLFRSIAIGLVWMAIHAGLLILVAKLIKAPYFFLAVGSQANVGGAASAPVVAAAFHPSLATVGVLLAVFGYVVGTYGAMLCAYLMGRDLLIIASLLWFYFLKKLYAYGRCPFNVHTTKLFFWYAIYTWQVPLSGIYNKRFYF